MEKTLTIDQVTGYLRMKGIPKTMIQTIRFALLNDAMAQKKDLVSDRLYSSIAIMLHDTFGFGANRILRGLKRMDEIAEVIRTDEETWEGLMQKLKDETGIVIRTGENRLATECDPGEEYTEV